MSVSDIQSLGMLQVGTLPKIATTLGTATPEDINLSRCL